MSSGILIYLKIHSPNQSDNLMKHPGYLLSKGQAESYLGLLEPTQLCSAQLVLGTDTPFIKSKAKSCHRELTWDEASKNTEPGVKTNSVLSIEIHPRQVICVLPLSTKGKTVFQKIIFIMTF